MEELDRKGSLSPEEEEELIKLAEYLNEEVAVKDEGLQEYQGEGLGSPRNNRMGAAGPSGEGGAGGAVGAIADAIGSGEKVDDAEIEKIIASLPRREDRAIIEKWLGERAMRVDGGWVGVKGYEQTMSPWRRTRDGMSLERNTPGFR